MSAVSQESLDRILFSRFRRTAAALRAPVLVLGLLAACDEQAERGVYRGLADVVPAVAEPPLPARPESSMQQSAIADRKIVRTGELGLQVADLAAARREILGRVQTAGGYVSQDTRQEYDRTSRLILCVRVPADRFDAFVEGLGSLGRPTHSHFAAADVTEQWVDVEARLGALREVEKRYLALIARAEKVTEVIEVQRELGTVRGEIESMDARMRSLRDRVAMSTLTITCEAPRADGGGTPRFAGAFWAGWDGFVRLLVAAVHLWPLLFVVLPLAAWLVVRRRRRTAAGSFARDRGPATLRP